MAANSFSPGPALKNISPRLRDGVSIAAIRYHHFIGKVSNSKIFAGASIKDAL
jgi:hypothetical protein